MKKNFFQILAKLNRSLLPSLSKRRVDLAKATNMQKLLIAYRYYITTRAID